MSPLLLLLLLFEGTADGRHNSVHCCRTNNCNGAGPVGRQSLAILLLVTASSLMLNV